MSRNAEYQFVPTDTSTIEALLVALCCGTVLLLYGLGVLVRRKIQGRG